MDRDRDGDLGDDGPPFTNQGSGPVLAAAVPLVVPVATEDEGLRERPYGLWMWFRRTRDGGMEGRFYARSHYRGTLRVGDGAYTAVAFETAEPDGLLRDAGLCIDLDADGRCGADERFRDGDVVPFPGRPLRLALLYP